MAEIEYGNYYHVYNRGINKTNLFDKEKDYLHFLELIQKYLLLIADIYCYVLMKNHFHILVRIKEIDEIDFLAQGTNIKSSEKWKTFKSTDTEIIKTHNQKLKKPVPYRQFSHLFNSYTKWFNHKYNRTGSLFEKNNRKKEVDNEEYLKHLVFYIHHNPIHHKFAKDYIDYPWVSYNLFTENKSSFLDKDTVVEWFDDLDNFIYFHQEEHDLSQLGEFLIDDEE